MTHQRRIHYRSIAVLIFLMVFTQSVAGQPTGVETAVSNSLNIVSPSTSVTFAEMDDFATTVLGDPWDMNEATDLAFYRRSSQFENSTFANGFYSAYLTNGNGGERITLLTAGAINNTAMRIGKLGYNYPINADHYRYLTFRMYKGSNSCASGLVRWYADDSYTNSVLGISNSYATPCTAGWGIYVVDLRTVGIQAGGRGWNGIIRELILHPYAGVGSGGTNVRLDWARLTAEDPLSHRPYDITWSGDGVGGDVTLYASPNDQSLGSEDDIVIATDQSAYGGAFTFQTGLLPAGTYYIAAVNGSGAAWSQAPLIISAPPQVAISRPSMLSGADYAETEKGNAWDMSDSSDLNDSFPIDWDPCISDPSFSNGIYRAAALICPIGDQKYSDTKLIMGHMNPSGSPDPVIDTNKYRYLNFRFRLDGVQDVAEGWVARWGWWQLEKGGLPGSETVMSRDIMLLEGWTTYSVDLWADDVIDENHPVKRTWRDSAPNRLRFDPVELHSSLTPGYFEIDWFKLTAIETVSRNSVYPIEYSLESARQTTLTFYYDTDTNKNNGRSRIGLVTREATTKQSAVVPKTVTQADHSLYLPMIVSNTVQCGNSCFAWNTTGIAQGDYYICVESNNGLNATYSCSDAPLRVE